MINVRLHLPLTQLRETEIKELIRRTKNEMKYQEIDIIKGEGIIRDYVNELNRRASNEYFDKKYFRAVQNDYTI